MENKQDLIDYLVKEKAERENKINDYGDACERLEVAKNAYEDAKRVVDSYGNIDDINAEIVKISGFICLLTDEDKKEENNDTTADVARDDYTPLVTAVIE